MNRFRFGVMQLFRLGWFDLVHERWFVLSASCVLAATMAPLLTLLSLERGIVGNLVDSLERDPLMRMVVPTASGSAKIDQEWLQRVRSWREVAFVIPTIRYTAALVEVHAPRSGAAASVPFQPTAAGDPMLAGLAQPGEREVILAASVVRRLKVAVGDEIQIALSRQRGGLVERTTYTLRVAALLPEASSDIPFSVASSSLLEAIESWRDGYTIPWLGETGNGPAPARSAYPLFRLHAHSIVDVQPLSDRFESEGLDVRVRTSEIASALGLQSNLNGILAVVAVIGIFGALVALSSLQFSSLQRKRREHALLRLVGYGSAWLLGLAALNAVAVALVGSLFAMILVGLAAAGINGYFAQHLSSGESAARILGLDLGSGLLVAVVVSILPAIWAAIRAVKRPIADELREV